MARLVLQKERRCWQIGRADVQRALPNNRDVPCSGRWGLLASHTPEAVLPD